MPSSRPAVDVMLRVRGTVQGVGFRPFVHRTARQLGVHGWVRNDPQGVLIRAAGDPASVGALVSALRHAAPPAARVLEVRRQTPGPDDLPPGDDFAIGASDVRAAAVTAALPADLALCADCRRELLDPADRRYRYPFINCTQCGPRYSIATALPYDRSRTTMAGFPLCPACRREYGDPADRRFHAEPIACPACGPRLVLTDPAGAALAERDSALRRAAAALAAGRIVAVQGLGGYHLMGAAADEAAVAALRARKHREEKPLAVMFRDLGQLRRYASVSPAAARLLESPAAPIVLVPALPGSPLAPSVAPGNPWIGALLPSTPLHVLLLAALDAPVVATSANLSEEPLCTGHAEAHARLAGIADLFLEHDRPIARPVDDSVVRLAADDSPILLRRARGHAPAPLDLPGDLPGALLCVGGHLKSAVAVAAGRQVVLSPHIGDLGGLATQEAFDRTIAMLGGLYGSDFAAVAHDQHPGYASTLHAVRTGLPRIAVQHHLAHVLACLLEHRHPAEDVLGIAWDGTGYGADGTVWGGEFLLLGGGAARRLARLRPFRLPGGEAAVRDARRVALALAHECGLYADAAERLAVPAADAAHLRTMLDRRLNSPVATSAGRLFDAAGALLGLGRRNTFEGQLPIAVETAARGCARDPAALPFPVRPAASPGASLEIDWQPALAALLRPGLDPGPAAAAFHRGLVAALVAVARAAGAGTVVLTGGCFQNALLHSLAADALAAAGFRVLVHRVLPPNDNALAAGQALGALLGLTSVTLPR
ncbi:MAG: carbamoyltransferase HypF [Opitutaceae bacterium]|nr:carbamoyltransferase HypF [Opitutaceae bacterium]